MGSEKKIQSQIEYPILVFDASLVIQLFTVEEKKHIRSIETLKEALEDKIFDDEFVSFDTYIEKLMEANICTHSTTKLKDRLISYNLAKTKKLQLERVEEDYFHIFYPLLLKDEDLQGNHQGKT